MLELLAALAAVLARARPDLRRQHPERQSGGGEDHRVMDDQPPRPPVLGAHRAQPLTDVLEAGVVEARGVLDREHHRLLLGPLDGGAHVRREELFHAAGVLSEQPVGGLGARPTLRGLGNVRLRARVEVAPHLHQPPHPARVAQRCRPELHLRPVRRVPPRRHFSAAQMCAAVGMQRVEIHVLARHRGMPGAAREAGRLAHVQPARRAVAGAGKALGVHERLQQQGCIAVGAAPIFNHAGPQTGLMMSHKCAPDTARWIC